MFVVIKVHPAGTVIYNNNNLSNLGSTSITVPPGETLVWTSSKITEKKVIGDYIVLKNTDTEFISNDKA